MSDIKLDKLPEAAGDVKKGGGRWWKILIAALMLGYIVFPTDLLPDLMPIVGWVDDLAAGVGMIVSVVSAIKNKRYSPDARMAQRAKDIFGDDNY